jgi:hypothetical protein
MLVGRKPMWRGFNLFLEFSERNYDDNYQLPPGKGVLGMEKLFMGPN